MAKKQKEEVVDQKDNGSQLDSILGEKGLKELHYGGRSGLEIDNPDIITTSSFFFDYTLGGGFRSSSWSRFYSEPECGKSSQALCWARNWQDFYPENGFVVYFNAEGRLTKDLVDRSGINTDKNKFRVVDCNNADAIFTIIEKLITNNDDDIRYFIVIDSTDACQRSQDIGKNLGEAEKIGGSATIQSAAGKRLSLLFNRKGHHLYMASQVRDKLNTHGPGGGGKDASGGNSPKFYSSLIGHIQKPWSETLIFEDPSDTKSKAIGRLFSVKLIKTPNEKTGELVQVPIRYGLIGGVWKAYEAMMISQSWNFYQKSGAWFKVNEVFMQKAKDAGLNLPESFQGERKMREYFDSNPELVEFVFSQIPKT